MIALLPQTQQHSFASVLLLFFQIISSIVYRVNRGGMFVSNHQKEYSSVYFSPTVQERAGISDILEKHFTSSYKGSD